MKTFPKLLMLGGALLLVLLVGLLLALGQMRSSRQASDLLSRAQGLRAEVLLTAAYASDLVTARQRNDAMVEQESIRLLHGTIVRANDLLAQMQDAEAMHTAGPGAARDVREFADLWQLTRDASESMVAGRSVLRHLEFVRSSSVSLVQRLNALVGAAERRREARSRTVVWLLVGVAGLESVLVGLTIWWLYAGVFAGMNRTLEGLQLLGSGSLSPEVQLPVEGCGEFRQVTHYLNRFLERIRESDRTKDRFLAAMSHEIRTPMNGVIGFLGNLRETPLNEQQRQYVRVIESSARSLLRVINEILDFSKLTAGRMTLEEVAFDLPRLAEDCVAMARQLVRGKAVKTQLELRGIEARVVRGDPTRLRQVLDNLLGNAAKFTDRGEIRLLVETVALPEEGLERAAVRPAGD